MCELERREEVGRMGKRERERSIKRVRERVQNRKLTLQLFRVDCFLLETEK